MSWPFSAAARRVVKPGSLSALPAWSTASQLTPAALEEDAAVHSPGLVVVLDEAVWCVRACGLEPRSPRRPGCRRGGRWPRNWSGDSAYPCRCWSRSLCYRRRVRSGVGSRQRNQRHGGPGDRRTSRDSAILRRSSRRSTRRRAAFGGVSVLVNVAGGMHAYAPWRRLHGLGRGHLGRNNRPEPPLRLSHHKSDGPPAAGSWHRWVGGQYRVDQRRDQCP